VTITYKQLGQTRPAGTTAVTHYTCPALTQTIVTNLIVANTSGSPATFRIFHDAAATTFDESTALYWDIAIAADESLTYVFLAKMNAAGSLGVRSSVGNALTFTSFGNEIT